MSDFKNTKHLNWSLDFNLTFIDCRGHVILQCSFFLEEVIFFHRLFEDIDIESASRYVAGKH